MCIVIEHICPQPINGTQMKLADSMGAILFAILQLCKLNSKLIYDMHIGRKDP